MTAVADVPLDLASTVMDPKAFGLDAPLQAAYRRLRADYPLNMARVPGGDAEYSATVTQAVSVSRARVLAMVEIRATRKGRELHNHAGFLARFDDDGHIDELWMVDALPAYSDEFWS